MSTQPLLQTAPGKRIALPTRVEPEVFFKTSAPSSHGLNADRHPRWPRNRPA
ncbi:unnamed protein product [Alternaria alternata]